MISTLHTIEDIHTKTGPQYTLFQKNLRDGYPCMDQITNTRWAYHPDQQLTKSAILNDGKKSQNSNTSAATSPKQRYQLTDSSHAWYHLWAKATQPWSTSTLSPPANENPQRSLTSIWCSCSTSLTHNHWMQYSTSLSHKYSMQLLYLPHILT